MASSTRATILMLLLSLGNISMGDLRRLVGPDMFSYHMRLLEEAGLIEVAGAIAKLSDFGECFLNADSETANRSNLRPLKVIEETNPLLSANCCLPGLRIAAKVTPLGRSLRILEGIFPGSRYAGRAGALVALRDEGLVILYSTGNVATICPDEISREDALKHVVKSLKEAVSAGNASVSVGNASE